MGELEGRVVIITGAGRGIGREHALFFAAEGAKVVVNDLGGAVDGSGDDRSPAQQVVDEITAAGGQAVANNDDVCDWEGGQRLIDTAVETFGDLHVLVNNAGILRDRVLVNMSESDWDSVIQVHLKGHFVPTRHAAAYWRARTKEGKEVRASVVNTSSTSGLLGNPGQANYGAAKAGIAAFTTIVADELVRYGVRVNAIAPAARTRMTEQTPVCREIVQAPSDPSTFDSWDPANVAPLAAYLATEGCPVTGRVYFIQGGQIRLFQPWTMTTTLEKAGAVDGGRTAGGDASPGLRWAGGRAPVAGGRTESGEWRGFRRRRVDRGRGSPVGQRGRGRGRDRRPLAPPVPSTHPPPPDPVRAVPVVGPVDRAGRPPLGQHHLHRLRGGPPPGGHPAAHHGLHPHLDLDRAAVGFRGGRPHPRKLGDLRGYRRLYLWGLGGAAVSVVLTATAPTAGVLIAARLFDGVQGAATGAASMALVLQAFSHGDRVKAMGWWALVGAGGPVLGVTIGAPIIQYLGWRALFWGELPLMAVAAVLAVVVLPSGRAGAGAGPVTVLVMGRTAPTTGPGRGHRSGGRPPDPGASSTGRARSPCRPP